MPTRAIRATLLKRYTHLPALLSVFQTRELTVLSPLGWEDKNDRVSMDEYARARDLKTVLGLCFSQAAETFHHWKVFAPGSSGVCIEFQKSKLLQCVPATGFRHAPIRYKRIAALRGSYATPTELPFIKGWAYRDEKEYRIIFSSDTETIQVKSFPIALSAVQSVVVNPWLPSALFAATREAIHKVPGCSRLMVTQSKVIDNEHWQAYARGDA